MNRTLIVSLWIVTLLLFSALAPVYAGSGKSDLVFVKKVKLEGNLILDDTELAESLDMGRGIYLTPDLLPLVTEEVEGFYSSHGFHRVRANIPLPKIRKGVLTVSVDEEREIREGKSDVQRAEVAVARLVARNELEPGKASWENAVATLVEAYRLKRARSLEAEKKRIQAEKAMAQIQRDRYLGVQEEKRKAEAEDLKARREALQSIFASQQKLIDEQKEEAARRLTEMRRRMRTILDTKFNGG